MASELGTSWTAFLPQRPRSLSLGRTRSRWPAWTHGPPGKSSFREELGGATLTRPVQLCVGVCVGGCSELVNRRKEGGTRPLVEARDVAAPCFSSRVSRGKQDTLVSQDQR